MDTNKAGKKKIETPEQRAKQLAYAKEYKQKNKEMIANYNKSYYGDNKDKVKSLMTRIVQCKHCGKALQKSHLPRHQRSASCQAIQNKIKQ